MPLAKITKIVSSTIALAQSGSFKDIKVSIPVNVAPPAEGAEVEISKVEELEKAQAKGKPLNILRANLLRIAADKTAPAAKSEDAKK